MDENKELLIYLYQDCDMGLSSTKLLLNKLNKTDNKLNKVVEEELKGYENFLKDIKKLLNKYKYKLENNSIISKIGSTIGIDMEFMKDNSDSKIADMLIQGFTMGVINVSKKIDRYRDYTEKDIIKLAIGFKDFQTNCINDLKKYL